MRAISPSFTLPVLTTIHAVTRFLITVKQMEEALAKRKIKSKAKGNKQGLSDADKILLQLLLDVRSFGDQVSVSGQTQDLDGNNTLALKG